MPSIAADNSYLLDDNWANLDIYNLMGTQVPQVVAVDGPPGTGKTRTIVETAAGWTGKTAVVTYTNDAAGVLHRRAPQLQAGTVYSLTWPYVKPFIQGSQVNTATGGQAYSTRRIHHLFDPALLQYVDDAPSNKPVTRQDTLAKQLHSWAGGLPPFKLEHEVPKGALKFLLPLARWIEAGSPIPESEQLDEIAIDEAQDMSWVELRAAIALVKPSGLVTAYGDPGQSIFATAKGVLGGALPPLWTRADEQVVMNTGYRVGDPTATVAARVLHSYYDRPAHTFRAKHKTELLAWDSQSRPMRGLVLGYSRRGVAKAFRNWGLARTGIVPNVAAANKELVLSTGHAAKGAEADDVYILPWSRVAIGRFERRDPETIRLLYVMLTRAKRRVFLPRTIKARLPL